MKWQNLLELGTDRAGNSEVRRSIILSNVIFLVMMGLLSFYLITISLLRGYFKIPAVFTELVPFIVIFSGGLGLFLNSSGHPTVGKVIFMLIWMLSINVLPVLIQGTSRGTYYSYPIFCIVTGVGVHLLFSYYSEKWLLIFFLGCNLVLTFFSIDFLIAHDPAPTPSTPWLNAPATNRLINLICWLFVNVTIFYLLRINWRFYSELQLKHAEVEELNRALERRVDERTHELMDRNEKLSEYAFMIAHILRAPVSRIRGLLNLSQISDDLEDEQKIKELLEASARELDEAVHSISEKLSEKKKS